MRAKKVNYITKAYVFDFDDTLVKTNAKIKVYDENHRFIRYLTTNEFKSYEIDPDYILDFSEFNDPTYILQGRKYKMWPILVNVYNAKIQGRSNSDVYILTARSEKSKYTISSFLHRNNIDLPLENILTIGNDSDVQEDIAIKKHNILSNLKKRYDIVNFFDDSIDNIELAKKVDGITTRLVDWIK